MAKEPHAECEREGCERELRAHKTRQAAVFKFPKRGSEQGMHWSRGNGAKTCRYIHPCMQDAQHRVSNSQNTLK